MRANANGCPPSSTIEILSFRFISAALARDRVKISSAPARFRATRPRVTSGAAALPAGSAAVERASRRRNAASMMRIPEILNRRTRLVIRKRFMMLSPIEEKNRECEADRVNVQFGHQKGHHRRPSMETDSALLRNRRRVHQ